MMHTRLVMSALVITMALTGFTVASGYAAPASPAAPAGRVTPASPAAPGGAIAVSAREFLYAPKQFAVKAGDVTFAVKNTGAVDHDFVIENAAKKKIAEATPFPPGKTVQVKAKLTAGTYTIFCSIPGHREAGMHAPLKVNP
ncbi:MAG: cupredoxin domain-containing protein [Armatimonadota bacterium]